MDTIKVELIFEPNCRNAEPARRLLVELAAKSGIAFSLQEVNKEDPGAPFYSKRFGSPTILVDGSDVVPTNSGTGQACRLYMWPDGTANGYPPMSSIAEALRRATEKRKF